MTDTKMSKYAMNTINEMERDYREEISQICEACGPFWKADTEPHDFSEFGSSRTRELWEHITDSISESKWTQDWELCRLVVLFYREPDVEPSATMHKLERCWDEWIDLMELMEGLAIKCMVNDCERLINESQASLARFVELQGEDE